MEELQILYIFHKNNPRVLKKTLTAEPEIMCKLITMRSGFSDKEKSDPHSQLRIILAKSRTFES